MKPGEKATDLFCCRCGEIYHGQAHLSFMALRLFQCPACGHANKFPPGAVRFGCLGLVFAKIALVMVLAPMQGAWVFPGLLGILFLFAFQNAVAAVIRVRQARKFHQERGRLPGDWKGW